MLKNIFVISTLFAAAHCSSELSVIATPEAVLFKPSDSGLKCATIEPIICASMGKSIEPTDFKNLYIQDPFNTADKAVLISVTGSSKMNYQPLKTTSYSVTGNDCFPSIANTMNHVTEDGSSVLDLDLSRGAQVLKDYEKTLGKIDVQINNIKCDLSVSDNVQKLALEQIGAFAAIGDALTKSIDAPAFTHIHVTFADLTDNSKAHSAATQCFAVEVGKFKEKLEKTFGNVLILSYATKEDRPTEEHKRSRRATDSKVNDDLNLAKIYDDNYPVIFNIILWFGVVIAFSLYAVSYAIATMDPGRDSIIYRMTSTRIKKDN